MSNVLPSIGIVLPCFNEEEILQQTDKKNDILIENLIQKKLVNEKSLIVYVDDGGLDKTWEIIQDIVSGGKYRMGDQIFKKFWSSTCSFGWHHKCLSASGLYYYIGIIKGMMLKYSQGFDIIYGVRRKRNTDNYFKRKTAFGFYFFIKKGM